MTNPSEREKLIVELENKIDRLQDQFNCCVSTEEIADFILEERKRIVEPLVVTKDICMRAENIGHHAKQKVLMSIAIDETLQRAGIDV